MKTFLGTVVGESLRDSRFLNELEVLSARISDAAKPEDRWHLYRVVVGEKEIYQLADQLKSEKWYAHFWDNDTIYAVFPGKVFEMERYNKTTWKPAIDYGLKIHIPKEQLDFLIDE